MHLQFPKNPITDYQQVTNDKILPNFQNNFPSLDFIARKSRLRKSKCKEKGAKCDILIYKKHFLFAFSTCHIPHCTFYLSHFIRPLIAQINTDSFQALFLSRQAPMIIKKIFKDFCPPEHRKRFVPFELFVFRLK